MTLRVGAGSRIREGGVSCGCATLPVVHVKIASSRPVVETIARALTAFCRRLVEFSRRHCVLEVCTTRGPAFGWLAGMHGAEVDIVPGHRVLPGS